MMRKMKEKHNFPEKREKGKTVKNTLLLLAAVAAIVTLLVGCGLAVGVSAEEEITVTYDLNGGTGTPPSSVTGENPMTVTIADKTSDMERENYIFTGWQDDEGTPYNINEDYMFYTDTVLYAQWTEIVTFTYDGNGHTSGDVPSAVTGNPSILKVAVADQGSLEKEGYTFTGWNTEKDGNGNKYEVGEEYRNISTSVTLYAQWKKSNVTITFNVNLGEGTPPDPITADNGAEITIPDKTDSMKKRNSAFQCWNTKVDGTGTLYNVNDTASFTDDTTLYAKWETGATVSYDVNGGEGTPPPSETKRKGNNASIAFIASAPTQSMHRDGYVFRYWRQGGRTSGYIKYAGDIVYTSTDTVLYAQWEDAHTLYYDVNGGEGEPPSPQRIRRNGTAVASFTVQDKTESMHRDGYVFSHWHLNNNKLLVKNYRVSDTITFGGSMTLYAIWVPENSDVTVTYDVNSENGGTGTPPDAESGKVLLDVTIADKTASMDREGYLFEGWNEAADGTDRFHTVGSRRDFGIDTTLYAQWKKGILLKYDGNGSTSGSVPASRTEAEAFTATIAEAGDLAKTGHVFDGWNTKADGSGDTYEIGTEQTIAADTTLYARWKDIPKYTITYQANNGTGDTQAVPNITSGTEYEIAANAFTAPSGRQFDKWELVEPTDKGYPETAKQGDKITVKSNVIYKAVWKDIPKYTITYQANNGTGDTQAVPNITSGTEYEIAANAFTAPSGRQFDKWELVEPTDQGYPETAKQGDKITVGSNVTYKAVWKDLPKYTVTYLVTSTAPTEDQYELPTDDTDYDAGDEVVVKYRPGVDGYEFKGWTYGGTTYSKGDTFEMPAANVTLEGAFQKKSTLPDPEPAPNPNGETFTITYTSGVSKDADGYNEALGIPHTFYAAKGQPHTLYANDSSDLNYVRTGYRFIGWQLLAASSGSGSARVKGDFPRSGANLLQAGNTITPSEDMMLTAVWQKLTSSDTTPGSASETFTITYDRNGATSGTAPQDANSPYAAGTEAVILGRGILEKNGARFVGWNTKKNGTGTFYRPNATVVMNRDITLYAIWDASPTPSDGAYFTLTYQSNGATGGDVPQDYNRYYGGERIVVAARGNLVREDCTFKEWNTKPNGTGLGYQEGTDVLTMPQGSVTLYAIWQDSNGNILSPSPRTGESAAVMVMAFGAAVLSLSAGTAAVIRRRKNR